MFPGPMAIVILILCIIVLLIVAAAAFMVGMAIWSGLCTGCVFLLRPKGKRWPWLVAAIPLFIPAYVVALAVLVWGAMRPNPTYDFEYAFDMPVPATVQVHETRHEGWADYEDVELYFTATPADIQAIAARGLTLDPGYGAQQPGPFNPSDGSAPIPWGRLEVYTGGSPNQRFHSETAVLVYDPSTGESWYRYDGVD